MIALWIICGIVLIITILLNCPVTADLSYINKVFDVHVKYLFINIYPVKEKPEKKRKVKKEKKEKQKKLKQTELNENTSLIEQNESTSTFNNDKYEDINLEEDETEKYINKKNSKEEFEKKKDEIFEKIEFFKMILESSKKGARRLIKNIKISDIDINFIVANEDAYQAAIGYGKVNMVTYNVISFLRSFFNISIKEINIFCKYNNNESKYDGRCRVKLRPITVLLSGISIFYHYLINTSKNKKEKLKNNAQTAS